MRRRTQVAALIAAAAGCIALVAWWTVSPSAEAGRGAVTLAAGAQGANPAQGLLASAGRLSGPGSATTAGIGGDAFLNPALRHKLEDMLLDAQVTGTPEALKQQLAALVARHFSAQDAVRAAELAGRYVDYRVAVSRLKPPRDVGDPHALRQALEARQQERRRHFSDEEWQALFAAEEELDRFTIARLEVNRNPSLTAEQKQRALREAESELGATQRLARAEITLHQTVAAQTAALDAAGADDQQRYQQRRAAHGDAAAQQLARLDREEADWQARLDRLAAAQASGNAAQVETLRQTLFDPQEQLRIEAALALRKLPKP